jgi:hypothetical protein
MPIRPPNPSSTDGGFLARWSRVKTAAGDGRSRATAPVDDTTTASRPPAVATAPIAAPPPESGLPAPVAGAPIGSDGSAVADPTAAEVAPPPTLDDAAALQPGSEVSRFMARDVSPEVRHAALKQLFADPAFNVMDGLDTYIDDYGRPDPLPAAWLRKMASAASLNLFSDDERDDASTTDAASTAVAAAPASPPSESPAHEDPDLRLQPDDADRPPGPATGTGADAGREC